VLAQPVEERRNQPVPVPNLQRKRGCAGSFSRNGFSLFKKIVWACERIFVEVRKLHQDDREVFTQGFRGAEEFIYERIRIQKNPFVLKREREIGRSFSLPILEGGLSRAR
jgi:hypothetical protein